MLTGESSYELGNTAVEEGAGCPPKTSVTFVPEFTKSLLLLRGFSLAESASAGEGDALGNAGGSVLATTLEDAELVGDKDGVLVSTSESAP